MTLFDAPIKGRDKAVEAWLCRMTECIGEGWEDIFKGADDILYGITEKLVAIKGTTICPGHHDVFRAFTECKYSQLNVVFLLQDPYHQVINKMRVADGIAMSCRNTGILQPSLKLVYEEIERTVGVDSRIASRHHRSPDLVCWANQGILMLNTALTVTQGIPGSHADIWRDFTKYLLSTLSARNPSLIWVLMGTEAKSFSPYITQGTKLYTSHPASAAYRGGRWDSGDVFNNINTILKGRGQQEIKW